MSKKGSFVWSYFYAPTANGEGQQTKTKCKLCFVSLAYYNSTTSMSNHLKAKQQNDSSELSEALTHLDILDDNDFIEFEIDDDEEVTEADMASYFDTHISERKWNQITDSVLKYIVGAGRPLSTICHPLFINMMKESNSYYRLPCKRVLTKRLIPNMVNMSNMNSLYKVIQHLFSIMMLFYQNQGKEDQVFDASTSR